MAFAALKEPNLFVGPCGYKFITHYGRPIPPEALAEAERYERAQATRRANRNRLLPVGDVLAELVADAKPPKAATKRKPQKATFRAA